GMAAAALRLPSVQRFGVDAGQIPALIHEAYAAADSDEVRCRLAAALARAWVYGGDADRAPAFADVAVKLAEDQGDPALMADALVTDDLDAADLLIARTMELGAALGEPDLDAVVHSLGASRARQVGDVDGLRFEATAFEEHGVAEGIPSVLAEAAVLWLAAGELEHASELLTRVASPGLATIVRDVDFLLTISCL